MLDPGQLRRRKVGDLIHASLPPPSRALTPAGGEHSDLRQVPDTQEVFMAPDSDLSLIVEVLELVKQDGAGDSLEKALK